MSRVSLFNSPLLLGFDNLEQVLDRAGKNAGDGYPPYNIERLPAENDSGELFRITLAIAGFTPEQVDLTLENNQLVVQGKQVEDKPRTYLHRGIAAREFRRTFVLAAGIEVLGAELRNGLLSIDLSRPKPERQARQIEIKRRD